MSISNDAILIFGIELPEDDERGSNFWWSMEEKLVLAGSKISLVQHCSYDYPMWIIGLRDSEHMAWRGEPKHISLEAFTLLDLNPIEEMKEFCDKYEIKWTDPAWLLCTMNG